MEDRIRLRVLGLSYSKLNSGAYALLLKEEYGINTIPVVIGAAEAQSIAMAIESVQTPRPQTHDLFMSFAHAFGIKLKEVFIYKFEDGVFYSELTFTDGERQVVLDARTSDAVAIAMRTHTPILTTHAIVEETGFIMEEITNENLSDQEDGTTDEGTDEIAQAYFAEPKLENYAIEELQRTLERLTEEENYEEAAKVNEILQRKLAERDNASDSAPADENE
ncbi:MAG: bifunctional nuclease family protein [Muribaculaceae bacterium]|nr:bifunctional nuclease family protein [Muribaculaceae bacterium]